MRHVKEKRQRDHSSLRSVCEQEGIGKRNVSELLAADGKDEAIGSRKLDDVFVALKNN
jgi:hypothetical protein